MPSPDRRGPAPLPRTRLYERVAQQLLDWIDEAGLTAGGRLPAERELSAQLGVSRTTLSQALVALEVSGIVDVRHGDGAIVTGARPAQLVDTLRAHASRLPDVLDAREALETKLAALAAQRRGDDDLRAIDIALDRMAADVDGGGRGDDGDRLFHAAVTEAAHSPLLAGLMAELQPLIAETRVASLARRGRPPASLASHGAIAEAIRRGDPDAAGAAMQLHLAEVREAARLG